MKRRGRVWALMAIVAVVALGLSFVREAVRNSSIAVEGRVKNPSRIPIAGRVTVLDILNASGGILADPDSAKISVVRRGRGWTSGDQVFPVNLGAILMKGDAKTNYVLEPGDRLIVR